MLQNIKGKFIIHDHEALKAGKHQDFRFEDPRDKKNWLSFAVRKGVPTMPGNRVLAVKTHLHSKDEALFTGQIPKGQYGAGKLSVFDKGNSLIIKYSSAHIVIELKGKKIKGIYHLINLGVTNKRKYKDSQYLLFKGAVTLEEIYNVKNR